MLLGTYKKEIVEALELNVPKEEYRKSNAQGNGASFFVVLIALEEKWHDLDPDNEKLVYWISKTILNELYNWVFHLNAPTNSLLNKAASHTRNQWAMDDSVFWRSVAGIHNNRTE